MRYEMLLDNYLVTPPIPWVLFDLGTPTESFVFRYFADYIIESTHFYLYNPYG